MFIGHVDEIEKVLVGDVEKQILIGPQEGWSDHVMRLFTLKAGQSTPRHSHPWPHIIYVLEGEGLFFFEGEDNPIQSGSLLYVDPDSLHQLINKGEGELKFICIVPKEGEG
ncbi:MAG: cupin domain-containing protein [Spirochaetales bacterium]|nr:cupin domain-containing protein [Spirochaetales bacterium]